VSLDEIETIQAEVSNYLVEIADVLAKVPRSVLLLMKTNDLLKSIEKSLHVFLLSILPPFFLLF